LVEEKDENGESKIAVPFTRMVKEVLIFIEYGNESVHMKLMYLHCNQKKSACTTKKKCIRTQNRKYL